MMSTNALKTALIIMAGNIFFIACNSSGDFIEIKRHSEWEKNRCELEFFDKIDNEKKKFFSKYLHDKKGCIFERKINGHNVTFLQTESLCFFLIDGKKVDELESLIEKGVRQSYPVIVDINGDGSQEILLVLEYEEGAGLYVFGVKNNTAEILYELPVSVYQINTTKPPFVLKHLNDDKAYDIYVKGALFYIAGYEDLEEGFYEAKKDLIIFHSYLKNNNLIYKIINLNEIRPSAKNSLVEF